MEAHPDRRVGEFTTSAPPREIAAREIGRSLWHRFRLFVDLCRWPISARAARNTEPTGKRPQNAPGIPGLWGSPAFKHDEKPTGLIATSSKYRSCWERLPILPGEFTDRRGVDYRPLGETLQIKSLQTDAFGRTPSVYMMLCLCLLFCLVNRE